MPPNLKMHVQGIMHTRTGSTKRGNRRRTSDKELVSQAFGIKMAKCLLATSGEWTFNVFNLDKLTNGRSLFHISLHVFQEHNLMETFQLDIVKLMRCFSLLEDCYHNSNPYHNAVHAADVTQAMHCFLKESKLAEHLTPLEKLVAILSAITHDLDHPGVNQAFLIATSNPLAELYKKTSVLENHHWRAAIAVLHESGVFDHFDENTWNNVECQMKSLILSTDITRQQEFLSRLTKLLDSGTLNMRLAEHRHFMLQIALKCADICNPCRPWEISHHWSQHVCDEFFKQGDSERRLQLPVTPLCDRHNTSIAQIQSGFMKFVVQPLFSEWHRFDPSTQNRQMLDNIALNQRRWQEMAENHRAEHDSHGVTSSSDEPSHGVMSSSDGPSHGVTSSSDGPSHGVTSSSDGPSHGVTSSTDEPNHGVTSLSTDLNRGVTSSSAGLSHDGKACGQRLSIGDEFVEGRFALPSAVCARPVGWNAARRHSLPPPPSCRRAPGWHSAAPARAPTGRQSRRHSLPHTASFSDTSGRPVGGASCRVPSVDLPADLPADRVECCRREADRQTAGCREPRCPRAEPSPTTASCRETRQEIARTICDSRQCDSRQCDGRQCDSRQCDSRQCDSHCDRHECDRRQSDSRQRDSQCDSRECDRRQCDSRQHDSQCDSRQYESRRCDSCQCDSRQCVSHQCDRGQCDSRRRDGRQCDSRQCDSQCDSMATERLLQNVMPIPAKSSICTTPIPVGSYQRCCPTD